MKNKILKYTSVLTIVVGIVLLSGCVENTKSNNISTVPVSTQISGETSIDNISKIDTIEVQSTIEYTNASKLSTKSESITFPDWCYPGDTMTVAEEEFTILGITTDDYGNKLCKAEAQIPNGKSEYWFSEDGSISKMTSNASSNNGSVSASSSASASSGSN